MFLSKANCVYPWGFNKCFECISSLICKINFDITIITSMSVNINISSSLPFLTHFSISSYVPTTNCQCVKKWESVHRIQTKKIIKLHNSTASGQRVLLSVKMTTVHMMNSRRSHHGITNILKPWDWHFNSCYFVTLSDHIWTMEWSLRERER